MKHTETRQNTYWVYIPRHTYIHHGPHTPHKPQQNNADRTRDQKHHHKHHIPADTQQHPHHGHPHHRQQKHRRSIPRRHGQDHNRTKTKPRSQRRPRNLHPEPQEILQPPPETKRRKSSPTETTLQIDASDPTRPFKSINHP